MEKEGREGKGRREGKGKEGWEEVAYWWKESSGKLISSCDRHTSGLVVFDLFRGTGGGTPAASGETLRCDRSGWGM